MSRFWFGKDQIEFSNDSSISSSTCRKKTTYRTKFSDKIYIFKIYIFSTFLAVIYALCDNAGRAFTST